VWYFTDADWLPFNTSINSLNWTDAHGRKTDAGGIGEIGGRPRPWSNGRAPDRVLGATWCGDYREFVTGGHLLGSPKPVGPDGWPLCCLPPVRVYVNENQVGLIV